MSIRILMLIYNLEIFKDYINVNNQIKNYMEIVYLKKVYNRRRNLRILYMKKGVIRITKRESKQLIQKIDHKVNLKKKHSL